MNQSWKRWMVAVVALVLLMGTLLGAMVGGFLGYLMAEQSGETQPVSLEQPAPVTDPALALPTPAAPPAEFPQSPAPEPGEDPIVSAVQRAQPATVRVRTNQGSGSGFIISESGYVVTNHHVVEGARQFVVDYARGEQVPATLVGSAPDFDLAVLKVDGPVPATITWGDSSAVPLGGQVIAIGSALGDYQNSVTVGILSGVNRELGNLIGLLQTDAAINHGNSGGPLLNRQGEVIGINTMVVRGGRSDAEGLGFAIPSNVARAITQQLIETGQARRPLMGVSLLALNSQVAQEYGLSVTEGAYIQQVTPNSAADQAGLQAGDVILAIAGRPVTDREPLQMHVLSHVPGEQFTITVLRGGQQLEVPLTLGAA